MDSLKWFLVLSYSMVALSDTIIQNKEKDRNSTNTIGIDYSDLALPKVHQLINNNIGADMNKINVLAPIVKYNSSIPFCDENKNVVINVSNSNQTDFLRFFESKMKNVSDCLIMCSVNLNHALFEACAALVSLKRASQIPMKTISSPPTNSSKNITVDNNANTVLSENTAKTDGLRIKNGDLEEGPDPSQDQINQDNVIKSKPKELPQGSNDENKLGGVPQPKVNENTELENSKSVLNFDQSVDESSHYYLYQYFVIISCLCVIFYFFVYNKKKFLALLIEGRRKNGRRRRYSAAYSRLDTNLEEALTSAPSTSTSNVIAY